MGLSPTTTVTYYTYRIRTATAICFGPIDKFVRFDYNSDFKDYNQTNTGSPFDIDISDQILYAKLYWGTNSQPADTTNLGQMHTALYYRNICYASFHLDLGKTPSMPATSYTVCRWYIPAGFGTLYNKLSASSLNPAVILYDILTSPHYGFGLSTSLIDLTSFTDARDTLYSEDLGYSTSIQGGEVYATVRAILDWVDGELVYDEDTNKIALKLRRHYTYTPFLPEVTEENIKAQTFELTRPSWYATKNCIYVNFFDTERECDQNAVYAEDLANYNLTGNVRVQEFNFDCFTNADMAQKVAIRLLYRHSFPHASIQFVCFGSKGDELQLFEPFAFSHSYYGISGTFRVTEKRREGPNLWKIEAMEERYMSPAAVATNATESYNTSNIYGTFESVDSWSFRLLDSYYRDLLFLGYSNDQSTNTILDAFDVLTGSSSRRVDYACIGRLKTSILGSGSATVYCDLDRHFQTAPSAVNFILVDDEIMKVDSMSETTTTVTYNCSTASRAYEDTTIASHSVSAKVYMLDCKAIDSVNLVPGVTITLQATPHYMYPKPWIDFNDMDSMNYTYQGLIKVPMEPSNINASSSDPTADITFTWTFESRDAPLPIPCTGLSPYPQVESGGSLKDQIIGWKIWHSYTSGTTSLLTVYTDSTPTSYVSTYAARSAAGLTGNFKIWVSARGILGYDSPALTKTIP